MPIEDTERNEVLARIRELFSSGGPRNRDQAIQELSRELGFGRVGPRIRKVLSDDLRTAVRRGILDNSSGEYRLLCRQIEEYELGHLLGILLASMGAVWRTREEATVTAARHLGFRRTGPNIRAAFRSAINAGIRRGLIERDGPDLIRRAR